ncbi:hypothetical protein Tco_1088668 [Tanacetum coccineum]
MVSGDEGEEYRIVDEQLGDGEIIRRLRYKSCSGFIWSEVCIISENDDNSAVTNYEELMEQRIGVVVDKGSFVDEFSLSKWLVASAWEDNLTVGIRGRNRNITSYKKRHDCSKVAHDVNFYVFGNSDFLRRLETLILDSAIEWIDERDYGGELWSKEGDFWFKVVLEVVRGAQQPSEPLSTTSHHQGRRDVEACPHPKSQIALDTTA